MRKLQCRTIASGGKFYDNATGSLVAVRDNHTGLFCEGCPWHVQIPNRMGKKHIEFIRKTHMGTVHFYDVKNGTMQASEEDIEWTPSGSLSFSPS